MVAIVLNLKRKMKSKIANRKDNIFTVICFIVILFGTAIFSIFNKTKYFSENENRVLTAKPKADLNAIMTGEFKNNYETYISDQFVLRDEWIRIKTISDYLSFKRDINNVYICKNGYLIEKQDDYKFKSKQAKDNYKYLSEFVNKYKNNIKIKVMLVPTASEILADKLPLFAYNANETKIIDEVYNEIGIENTVNITDTLINHRDENIFYKTDHHWTSLGAFYAYSEYAKAVSIYENSKEDFEINEVTDNFYGTMSARINLRNKADKIYTYKLRNMPDITITYNNSDDVRNTLFDDEALKGNDKYSVFLGGNNEILQMSIKTDSSRKLLVIKDSYSHCFIPFIVNAFSEIDVIDLRYYNDSIKEMIDENKYTDVLVLYGIGNISTDSNIFKLLY